MSSIKIENTDFTEHFYDDDFTDDFTLVIDGRRKKVRALFQAAWRGDVEKFWDCFRFLLGPGGPNVSVEVGDETVSLLAAACFGGSGEIVGAILSHPEFVLLDGDKDWMEQKMFKLCGLYQKRNEHKLGRPKGEWIMTLLGAFVRGKHLLKQGRVKKLEELYSEILKAEGVTSPNHWNQKFNSI